MMPDGSQNLYFHLGMNADDDGFVEHFAVMRMVGAKPDDMKILAAKGYVHLFDDKVLVILDWKENNYIRTDRYSPSKYLEIYKEELLSLQPGIPVGIPTVDERSTQYRLGKDSIGKNKEADAVASLPSFIDPKVWSEWLEYRKSIKKKMTDATVQKQIKFLSEHQSDYKEIIERSIQNGWTGLFPLKGNVRKNDTAKSGKYAQLS